MDWLINDALPVAACVFIVWIFPFSFLDKVLNWDAAVKQASSSWLPGGAALLYPAMAVELLTPPMIVFGFYGGIAAFVLAGYCAVTAVVYHNFWTYPRFWKPESEGYSHIWDFFKNFGLVGGLIFIMFASGFIGTVEADIETAAARERLQDWGVRMGQDNSQDTGSRPGTGTRLAMGNPITQEGDGPPRLSYWHVWADEHGVTHQTRCVLEGFARKSVGGKAAPEWIETLLTAKANIVFFVQPVGWIGEWHRNPKPQWLVTLSGRWFVETMDGTRVEMGPGEVSFGGDQASTPDDQGRFGHRSGTVGDELLSLMAVQLAGDEWAGLRPGCFR